MGLGELARNGAIKNLSEDNDHGDGHGNIIDSTGHTVVLGTDGDLHGEDRMFTLGSESKEFEKTNQAAAVLVQDMDEVRSEGSCDGEESGTLDDRSFWDHEYESKMMTKARENAATKPNIRIRKGEEDRDRDQVECMSGSKAYSSAKVIPLWIRQRNDFANIDKIISEQHLQNALEHNPYQRSKAELDLVAQFVMASWRRAQDLGPVRVMQIAKHVTFMRVEHGTYILRENESSRSFYIIVQGQVLILKDAAINPLDNPTGQVAVLGKGAAFGEIALTSGTTTASVVSEKGTDLLILSKEDYDRIMEDTIREENHEALTILRDCHFFNKWPRSRLDRVIQLVRRRRVKKGEIIIRQGDPPDNVYFISEGECEVIKNMTIESSNRWPVATRRWVTKVRRVVKPFKVFEYKRGGFFGEKAIVENAVRAATIRAVTDCVLLSLDKVEFMNLLNAGHKQSNADKGEGYPSDEDILHLFSALYKPPGAPVAAKAAKKEDSKKDKRRGRPKLASLGSPTHSPAASPKHGSKHAGGFFPLETSQNSTASFSMRSGNPNSPIQGLSRSFPDLHHGHRAQSAPGHRRAIVKKPAFEKRYEIDHATPSRSRTSHSAYRSPTRAALRAGTPYKSGAHSPWTPHSQRGTPAAYKGKPAFWLNIARNGQAQTPDADDLLHRDATRHQVSLASGAEYSTIPTLQGSF